MLLENLETGRALSCDDPWVIERGNDRQAALVRKFLRAAFAIDGSRSSKDDLRPVSANASGMTMTAGESKASATNATAWP